jgi:type I restriction enzyme R subunit
MAPNQTPEQEARDNIDLQLAKCGWYIQDRQRIDLSVGIGVAVREYPTSTGPADYVLFVNQTPVGVIEAKKEQEAARLSVHEAQVEDYANAQLKYIDSEPLPFLYLSTGVVTKFSDTRDPRPRYREVFTFHRPETLAKWRCQDQSLRARMSSQIPPLDKSRLRDCQIDAITNLETSFKDGKPRALVQMATGSGKTFTAITSVYRLLKHVKAERILFLVDTRNLGEQAEGEF